MNSFKKININKIPAGVEINVVIDMLKFDPNFYYIGDIIADTRNNYYIITKK